MSKGFEGTPGPWFHHPASGYEHSMGGYISASPDRRELPAICDIRGHGGMPYHENARLIAEAGTVLHETGLTPRQLAEQRAALLEALRYARRFLNADDHDTAYVDAAIALAQGDAA